MYLLYFDDVYISNDVKIDLSTHGLGNIYDGPFCRDSWYCNLTH